MRGSGLEDVFSEIFGPSTIDHIFSGKAYSRAVRAHFITQAALTGMLLDFLTNLACDDISDNSVVTNEAVLHQFAGAVSQDMVSAMVDLYKESASGVLCDTADDTSVMMNANLVTLNTLLHDFMCAVSEHSRTSKFWISYMMYVDLLKLFILAERTGDWCLHLDVMVQMLPLFAAMVIMQNQLDCMFNRCVT